MDIGTKVKVLRVGAGATPEEKRYLLHKTGQIIDIDYGHNEPYIVRLNCGHVACLKENELLSIAK